ncbi:MAG: hypothetical protein ACXW33_09515 [Sulfuricurvum sp.]
MKNLLRSILLTSTIAVSIQAGGDPVCSSSDLAISNLNQERYEAFTTGTLWTSIYFDTKTIKTDKKNKTIDVWEIYVPNASGRDHFMSINANKYQNFGLNKQFKRILFAQNKIILLGYSMLNCDGSGISVETLSDPTADNIGPNSLDEILKDSIMTKYNLK